MSISELLHHVNLQTEHNGIFITQSEIKSILNSTTASSRDN